MRSAVSSLAARSSQFGFLARAWFLIGLSPLLATSPASAQSPSLVVALRPASQDLFPTTQAKSVLSDQFLGQVSAAFQSIPWPVRQALVQNGWRVELVEYVTEAAPQLRGIRPRGWPEGMTWENTEAVHLPEDRLLILAEKRRTRRGVVVSSHRIEGTVRHELGHAFDLMVGGLNHFHSSDIRFVQAWQLDASQVSVNDREPLAYYLQANAPGRQEVFAEVFAVALGGGSDSPNRRRLECAFPESLALVRQLLADFASAESVR